MIKCIRGKVFATGKGIGIPVSRATPNVEFSKRWSEDAARGKENEKPKVYLMISITNIWEGMYLLAVSGGLQQ